MFRFFKRAKEPTVSQIKQYKFKGFMDKGATGMVHLATRNRNQYVIKEIPLGREEALKYRPQFTNETKVDRKTSVEFTEHLQHKNIIQIIDRIEEPGTLYIVMEHAGKPIEAPLSEKQCKMYFRQLVEGVDYLHKKGIVHRDLKTSNILVKGNRLRIADFGSAAKTKSIVNSSFTRSTPSFAAPETFHTSDACPPEAADLWSMGVILYNLYYGELPFKHGIYIHKKLKTSKQTHHEDTSPILRDLIDGLLIENPSERYTLDRVKHHPWLKR